RIEGLSREALEEIELGEGRLPDPSSGTMELVVGPMVAQNFWDAKTGRGFWETGEQPAVDLYGKPFFTMFQSSGAEESGKQKKYVFSSVSLFTSPLTGNTY
ncbi:hypothetical protein, partial [Adlercreutzia sp. DFI.6.23]|uniref:hypothetical protein n=1 Tax=Adlercreutzia sp. DFI.6.23 TaxID=2963705 RepID=UPI00210D46B7